MAAEVDAEAGDTIIVKRGPYRPRVALETIGALGRADSTTALVIETRTSDPGSPVEGQIWLRTDL